MVYPYLINSNLCQLRLILSRMWGMFHHESQLRLARTKQYDDQDSRSIKLQCVSCRCSHNTLWQSMPRERTRTHAGASISANRSCAFEKPIHETYTRVKRQNASPPRIDVVSFLPFPKQEETRNALVRQCELLFMSLATRHKLSGLCIGRKQRWTFHMQNTCAPQVPRVLEFVFVVLGAKTRPVVSSEKWSRWQSMQRFAEAAGSTALPFAPFLDRSLCLDRSIALSGESV